jgi:hypothetical protein
VQATLSAAWVALLAVAFELSLSAGASPQAARIAERNVSCTQVTSFERRSTSGEVCIESWYQSSAIP